MTDAIENRVLIIDDEPQIRRFLGISLRAQGYQILEAGSGREGLETYAARGADLIILDLGLPDMEGRDVLSQLRTDSSVPVIVVSARGGENEKVTMLDRGANDYVTKPFGIQELSARVRALLRRKPPIENSEMIFDDGYLRIDLTLRQAWREQEQITLSKKEWALLGLLLRDAGQVQTQPQLLRELWGPTHTQDTHYLRILVAKLRIKLGDDAANPKYIATEPGVGLRFLSAS